MPALQQSFLANEILIKNQIQQMATVANVQYVQHASIYQTTSPKTNVAASDFFPSCMNPCISKETVT